MEEFIQAVTSQLGLDESTARGATGQALGFLKDSLGDDFASLADKLPGASQMAESAASADGGGGGLLGSITQAASSMLGGGAGEGLELLGSLKNAGLSADQGGSFLTMLINFIKEKAGDSVLAAIADKVPALKSFLG